MSIEQNLPPQLLYKYRGLNNEFAQKILCEGEIYFATSDKLKDDLEKAFFLFKEGSYQTVTQNELDGLQTISCKPHIPGSYLVQFDAENKTKYFLNNIKRNEPYGIFSLCESNNSLEMYTHYADNEKGICIGFDWDNFDLPFADSYPPQRNIPRKVTYRTNPIKIDKAINKTSTEWWFEVFTTKSEEFSWEKEWRMFYEKGKLSSDRIRAAIKEIIFGPKISAKDISKVKEWIQDLPHVNLFNATTAFGNFDLKIVPY